MVKSNEYSLQKYGTIADIAIKEVQWRTNRTNDVYVWMGVVQMSGVRVYWAADALYDPVADVVPRNRFQ